jgi:NADPH2:quinone reductase
MRAALIEQIGEPPVVGEAAEPQRGPGQALVQVTAAPVNPVDIAVSKGTYPAGSPQPPYVPGREAVGRVLEGDALEPGTQIWFMSDVNGCMAEYAVAAEDTAVELPDGTDHALAGALGIAGLTGWLAVEWRAHVREGDRVLVLGATGMVGLVAVQAARILGAGRIAAAGRDPEALDAARAAGAHATVVLEGGVEQMQKAFEDACDGRPNVVIDPLWGVPARAAIEAAAFSARHVQLGQSAGPEVALGSGPIRTKSLAILGLTIGQVPREIKAAAHRKLLHHATSGALSIERETLPLDWVGEAWRRQESSPHRKLVVVP